MGMRARLLMRYSDQKVLARGLNALFGYFCLGLPFLILLLCLPVTSAFAEGDITLLLDTEEQYSDNFYRSETDKIRVYSTTIKPGVVAKAWTDRSSLLFAYSPTFNYYSDDSDRIDASENDFMGHELFLASQTTFFERLKFGLIDRFRETREPGAYDPLRQSVADRERYRINQVNPSLTYDFGERLTAIAGYQYEVYNFEDSDNSFEHRGTFILRYNFDDENSLEVEEQYWARRYPADPDYDSSQTKLIFRRQLGDALQCELGGGYHERKFESGATGVQDFDGFVYRVALTGETDLSSLFLSYRRNLNDFSKGSSYFNSHRVTLNVDHTFFEKITCKLGGYYQKNDYETATGFTEAGVLGLREDEVWDGSFSVEYMIFDWLFAGLFYEYVDRDSNIQGQDYDENRIFGNIKIEYSTAKRK